MSIFDQSHPRGAPPTIDQRQVQRRWAPGLLALCVAAASLTALGPVQADKNSSDRAVSAAIALTIDSASWSSKDARLRVSGKGTTGSRVTLVNAYFPSQTLGTNDPGRTGSWSISKSRPSPVPCRVRAVQANGQTAERTVSNAPSSCSPKAPSTNTTPTAKVNGPYSGTAGTAISFSSAGSTDLDGSIAGYAWTFGDGATATTANPTHAYATAGTFAVTLKVTDNLGAVSAASATTATITAVQVNQAPTAKVNGPYGGTTGTAISFSSAGSSDPDGTIAAYAWSFGDGANATTASPSHAYTTAGTYTVSLTVTDNLGKTSAMSSTTAAITAPVACNSSIPEHCQHQRLHRTRGLRRLPRGRGTGHAQFGSLPAGRRLPQRHQHPENLQGGRRAARQGGGRRPGGDRHEHLLRYP